MTTDTTTSSGHIMWCGDCRSDQLFEQPPCTDGHDADCPELACTGCGAAHIDSYYSGPAAAPTSHAAA